MSRLDSALGTIEQGSKVDEKHIDNIIRELQQKNEEELQKIADRHANLTPDKLDDAERLFKTSSAFEKTTRLNNLKSIYAARLLLQRKDNGQSFLKDSKLQQQQSGNMGPSGSGKSPGPIQLVDDSEEMVKQSVRRGVTKMSSKEAQLENMMAIRSMSSRGAQLVSMGLMKDQQGEGKKMKNQFHTAPTKPVSRHKLGTMADRPMNTGRLSRDQERKILNCSKCDRKKKHLCQPDHINERDSWLCRECWQQDFPHQSWPGNEAEEEEDYDEKRPPQRSDRPTDFHKSLSITQGHRTPGVVRPKTRRSKAQQDGPVVIASDDEDDREASHMPPTLSGAHTSLMPGKRDGIATRSSARIAQQHQPLGRRLQGLKAVYRSTSSKSVVEILAEDLNRLEPMEFLNDTVIDYYVKHLADQYSNKGKFYFFNAFFYSKLAEEDGPGNNPELRQRAHKQVKKWTKDVDIFAMDYIFVPIHDVLHWSLAVICYPGQEMFSASAVRGTDAELTVRTPCILHLDSMTPGHSTHSLGRHLAGYLQEEWKAKAEAEGPSVAKQWEAQHPNSCRDFLSSEMFPVVRCKVPSQTNHCDCGLFLLTYLEFFLEAACHEDLVINAYALLKVKQRDKEVSQLKSHFPGFLTTHWFPERNAGLLRAQLRGMLLMLLKETLQKEEPTRECHLAAIMEELGQTLNSERYIKANKYLENRREKLQEEEKRRSGRLREQEERNFFNSSLDEENAVEVAKALSLSEQTALQSRQSPRRDDHPVDLCGSPEAKGPSPPSGTHPRKRRVSQKSEHFKQSIARISDDAAPHPSCEPPELGVSLGTPGSNGTTADVVPQTESDDDDDDHNDDERIGGALEQLDQYKGDSPQWNEGLSGRAGAQDVKAAALLERPDDVSLLASIGSDDVERCGQLPDGTLEEPAGLPGTMDEEMPEAVPKRTEDPEASDVLEVDMQEDHPEHADGGEQIDAVYCEDQRASKEPYLPQSYRNPLDTSQHTNPKMPLGKHMNPSLICSPHRTAPARSSSPGKHQFAGSSQHEAPGSAQKAFAGVSVCGASSRSIASQQRHDKDEVQQAGPVDQLRRIKSNTYPVALQEQLGGAAKGGGTSRGRSLALAVSNQHGQCSTAVDQGDVINLADEDEVGGCLQSLSSLTLQQQPVSTPPHETGAGQKHGIPKGVVHGEVTAGLQGQGTLKNPSQGPQTVPPGIAHLSDPQGPLACASSRSRPSPPNQKHEKTAGFTAELGQLNVTKQQREMSKTRTQQETLPSLWVVPAQTPQARPRGITPEYEELCNQQFKQQVGAGRQPELERNFASQHCVEPYGVMRADEPKAIEVVTPGGEHSRICEVTGASSGADLSLNLDDDDEEEGGKHALPKKKEVVDLLNDDEIEEETYGGGREPKLDEQEDEKAAKRMTPSTSGRPEWSVLGTNPPGSSRCSGVRWTPTERSSRQSNRGSGDGGDAPGYHLRSVRTPLSPICTPAAKGDLDKPMDMCPSSTPQPPSCSNGGHTEGADDFQEKGPTARKRLRSSQSGRREDPKEQPPRKRTPTNGQTHGPDNDPMRGTPSGREGPGKDAGSCLPSKQANGSLDHEPSVYLEVPSTRDRHEVRPGESSGGLLPVKNLWQNMDGVETRSRSRGKAAGGSGRVGMDVEGDVCGQEPRRQCN